MLLFLNYELCYENKTNDNVCRAQEVGNGMEEDFSKVSLHGDMTPENKEDWRVHVTDRGSKSITLVLAFLFRIVTSKNKYFPYDFSLICLFWSTYVREPM